MTWAVINGQHLVPVDDLRLHEMDNCWCNPTIDDDDDTIIHNSMDGREAFESGERLPS